MKMVISGRLLLFGSLCFLLGCLVGGFSNGAKKFEEDRRLLTDGRAVTRVENGSVGSWSVEKSSSLIESVLSGKGLGRNRMEMLFEAGHWQPKESLLALENAGRFEDMEFVLRGWVEEDPFSAVEFLRYPSEGWEGECTSRLMSIAMAEKLGEAPQAVIEDLFRANGTQVDQSFYREILLRYGWEEADRVIRDYVLRGKWLKGGGGDVPVENHFDAASVDILSRWIDVTFGALRIEAGENAFEAIDSWYLDLLQEGLWNDLLLDKVDRYHRSFRDHEDAYRRMFRKER